LKSKKIVISQKLLDFDEIWNDDAHWPSETYVGLPEKNQNLQIQDGRRPSFEK